MASTESSVRHPALRHWRRLGTLVEREGIEMDPVSLSDRPR